MCKTLLIWFLSVAILWGDSGVDDKTAGALDNLVKVFQDTTTKLTEIREGVAGGTLTQEQTESLQVQEAELSARLDELKNQFDELATGVRGEDLQAGEEANIDLGEELRDILRPGVQAMKKARKTDAEGQFEALTVQLEQQEAEKEPIFKPVSEAFENFFRGRGLNLLKALGSLAGTWLVLRYLWRLLGKLPIIRRRDHGSFAWRLVELSSVVTSAVFAAIAALFVLYFSGDWLLLTLFLVFLVGLGWTAKSTIPKTFEQTKMLLNLGPVRKGERLTFEGVPWEVGTIGIYTELRNCRLTGGLIRMSINRLSTLRSRPHDDSEPWFPTKTGDWVLTNGSLGKVVNQTPEYVQVVRKGGARETYLTADFLALVPVNLSKSFRVRSSFGIDYQHQAISTTEAMEIFKVKLKAELVDFLEDREHLNSVSVEFALAGSSSLDYVVIADFKGEAADRHDKLERAIQRICVDVCNEQGWVIPFTQVTMHQAGS